MRSNYAAKLVFVKEGRNDHVVELRGILKILHGADDSN